MKRGRVIRRCIVITCKHGRAKLVRVRSDVLTPEQLEELARVVVCASLCKEKPANGAAA